MRRPLVLLLLGLALTGCRGVLQVGIERTPTLAAEAETPGPGSLLPGRAGLLYRQGDTLLLVTPDSPQPVVVGPLPADASHLALGARYLAYAYRDRLQALDLNSGDTFTLLDGSDRPHADFHMLWSADGSTLAYSMGWDAPDGGRTVELGLTDGYTWRTLATVVRPPDGPGPVLYQILAYERASARLLVRPLGDVPPEVWLFDIRSGESARVLSLPPETFAMAADPQGRWLALALPGELQAWPLTAEAESLRGALPPDTHATWLAFSPEGLRLAFTLHEGGRPGLEVSTALGVWVWTVNDGAPQPLWQSVSPENALLGWTSDGAALLVESLEGLTRLRSVVLVDASSGALTPVAAVCDGCRTVGWHGAAP